MYTLVIITIVKIRGKTNNNLFPEDNCRFLSRRNVRRTAENCRLYATILFTIFVYKVDTPTSNAGLNSHSLHIQCIGRFQIIRQKQTGSSV